MELTRKINSRLAVSIHSVASVAEQTAAGVQEVNASSTQQDKAIRDIARQAVEINDISQRLFTEINIFKIEEETGDVSPSGQLLVLEEHWNELNEPTEKLLAIAE